MLARNMRHKHYGIWNDTFLTYPDGKWFKGVNGGTRENFDGSESYRRPAMKSLYKGSFTVLMS